MPECTVPWARRLALAVEADVSPQTITKLLTGGTVKGRAGDRARSVLEKAGLLKAAPQPHRMVPCAPEQDMPRDCAACGSQAPDHPPREVCDCHCHLVVVGHAFHVDPHHPDQCGFGVMHDGAATCCGYSAAKHITPTAAFKD